MRERTKDMTEGKPGRLILSFAIPLMLGNIFQQLYSMVDTIVVGRGVGVEALAALGAAEWLNWLVLGIVMGFTQGFSILISQRFGAEDQNGLKKALTMSTLLSVVIAAVTLVSSLLLAKPILEFLNTPKNIIGDSLSYLTIIFWGIPVITAYNLLAAVLRAMGDSRTPLIAMIIAACINVGLDILFVMGFGWRVAGAAAATVIAQAFSCFFCLLAIRRLSILKTEKEDWKPDTAVLKRLMQLGTPMAFQNLVIAVGGSAVQYVINGFGFIFVAGFTATNKLYGILEVAATSFGFSMATFAGQNLGAKKYRRIQTGMRSAVKMALVTSLIISLCMIFFGKQILSLFVSGEKQVIEQVLQVAYTYLFVMSVPLFVLYILHLYRSALQGMGDTLTPMLSGIAELTMRIAAVLLLPQIIGQNGVYFAEIAAWLGADVILLSTYFVRIRKLLPKKEEKLAAFSEEEKLLE